MVDDQKYRVTLICKCSQDCAEGYGATPEEAREKVLYFWKKDNHKLKDIAEEILEVAVVHDAHGGSHYEEVQP